MTLDYISMFDISQPKPSVALDIPLLPYTANRRRYVKKVVLRWSHAPCNYSPCVLTLSAFSLHGKKWFCYGNKIRDNKVFVAAIKNFAAATKHFVDRTKHFVVVTKYFC